MPLQVVCVWKEITFVPCCRQTPNGSDACVFIAPPNIETLESRLRNRSTESEEEIQIRLSRAKLEIENSKNFDYTIINDVLETAISDLEKLLQETGLEAI